MFTSSIILALIAAGSIGGGLYLFGEVKTSHERRNAIEKMYSREQRYSHTRQPTAHNAPLKQGE